MQNIVNYIENFVYYKKYIINKRFLPIVLSVIFLYIAFFCTKLLQDWLTTNGYYILLVTAIICVVISFSWALLVFPWERRFLRKKLKIVDDYEIRDAVSVIYENTSLLTYKSNIEWLFTKLKLCSISGQINEHWVTIKKIEKLFLLPTEKKKLLIEKSNFFRIYQNVKDLKQTLAKLKSEDSHLGQNYYILYVINKSYAKELTGDIDGAKKELLDFLDSKVFKEEISIYNNIARLEEICSNYHNAIHYYEKAANKLLHYQKYNLFHVVFHNLVIINSKIKNYEKSKEWLDIYFNIVPKDNLDVFLEFYNTKVVLARQLNDQKMLLEAYNEIDNNIEPYLERDSWYNYFRTKLRMSFNDGVDFDKNITGAQSFFDELANLDFPKNYFSIKEIFSILNIIISNKGNLSGLEHLDNKTLAFMNKIIPDIKNYRKSIPNLAFSEQWFWLSEIINLQKLSFTNKVSYKKFNNFFNSLTELLRYAIDYENIFYEAKSYMIVCDEYIAYSKLLDKRFANDFRDFAEESIDNAYLLHTKNGQSCKRNSRKLQTGIPENCKK